VSIVDRDKLGRFIKKNPIIKVEKNILYLALWHKKNFVTCLFDSDDLNFIQKLSRLCIRRNYVCICENRTMKQISRLIIKCPLNMVVDHINGNTLDNRKSNLRIVTQLENCQNRTKLNKNNISGIPCASIKKYGATVIIDKERKFLGTFNTIDEAKNAIEKAKGKPCRKANKNNKVGYRGIYPIKNKAWVGIDGKRYYLGSFDTLEDAKKAIQERKTKSK
jgi:hypothetical protein